MSQPDEECGEEWILVRTRCLFHPDNQWGHSGAGSEPEGDCTEKPGQVPSAFSLPLTFILEAEQGCWWLHVLLWGFSGLELKKWFLTSASYLIPCGWELALVLEAKEESLFFFSFAFLVATPWGMKDLSYLTRDWTHVCWSSAVETWSSNH